MTVDMISVRVSDLKQQQQKLGSVTLTALKVKTRTNTREATKSKKGLIR